MSAQAQFSEWLDDFLHRNNRLKSDVGSIEFIPYEAYPQFQYSEGKLYVFEDQWQNKNNVVKSKILYDLGLSRRIFARKCELREIHKKQAQAFMRAHHSLDYARSKYHHGLFLNNELKAAASFARERPFASGPSAEMTRFCNNSYESVTGGLSKLITHYIRQHNPADIMSYSDILQGTGSAFANLGFKAESRTAPVKLLVRKKDGQRIPEAHFSDHAKRNEYVALELPGSIKYRLFLRPGSNQ